MIGEQSDRSRPTNLYKEHVRVIANSELHRQVFSCQACDKDSYKTRHSESWATDPMLCYYPVDINFISSLRYTKSCTFRPFPII